MRWREFIALFELGQRTVMLRALLVGSVVLVLGISSARADAIDGQWCLGASHFEINGPSIRTPGGNLEHYRRGPNGLTLISPRRFA